jgi:hypothetical protein
MEPAPPQYKGQPLQTVVANNGHVYALYGTRPYGREWLPLTTDTVPRLNLKSGNGLLSPGRDRYFYVSVEPNFDGLHRIIAPNFDFELENVTPVNHLYGPSQNDVVMYLHVHRLSGEQVTAVPLQRPYWGEYETGGWVGNRWISLHERRGKFGGNRYSLFVNVETGEKRLVGLVVNDENSTSDSGHLTFTHKGAFFLDFRPVYPSFEEPLPDFGDEQGWKAYYEKHLLRKEKRPWERRGEHYITEYALTPDGKKAILLDHRDWAEKKITSFTELPDDKTTPLASVLSPELVFIDLDKIETTKDPKRYSATTLLPKESRAYLQRDDGAGEIRVGGSEKVLWRKSFAEIAAP